MIDTSHNEALDLLYNIRKALNVAIECIEDRESLLADRDYWQAKYTELIDSNIKHSEQLTGGILRALISKGDTPQ